MRASALEARIFKAIRDELLTPERLRLMERTVREHLQSELGKLRDKSKASRSEAQLADVEKGLANVTKTIAA